MAKFFQFCLCRYMYKEQKRFPVCTMMLEILCCNWLGPKQLCYRSHSPRNVKLFALVRSKAYQVHDVQKKTCQLCFWTQTNQSCIWQYQLQSIWKHIHHFCLLWHEFQQTLQCNWENNNLLELLNKFLLWQILSQFFGKFSVLFLANSVYRCLGSSQLQSCLAWLPLDLALLSWGRLDGSQTCGSGRKGSWKPKGDREENLWWLEVGEGALVGTLGHGW